MTIYIDKPRPTRYRRFTRTAHMVSDESVKELHQFAVSIGLQPEWFQPHRKYPHYDLFDGKIASALKAGAQQVDSKTLLKKCLAGRRMEDERPVL